MKKLALTLIVLTSAPAFAADSPLLKCRAIADNTARLACYDAISPAAPVAPVAAAAAVAPANAVRPAPSAGAGAAAAATAAAAAAAAPTAAVAPVAVAAKPDDSFGKSSMSKSSEPEFIASYIPGAFDGWRPNMRINLANGQVWRVVDDSEGFVSGDDMKVKVVKGTFGAFNMEFEGSNRIAGVKRVK
jgi:hypothetical protein